MELKQTVEITLSSKEAEAVKTTAQILREICNQFTDCGEACPFEKLCERSGTYPHASLEDFLENCKITLDK